MRTTSRAGDRLLLLGACARALLQSALRSDEVATRFPGGIIALDFFGDADLGGAGARVLSVKRDFGLPRTVSSLGRAALAIGWESVVVAGGLENRPGLLRLLARRGRLLGCPPASVAAVRDPGRLFPLMAGERLPHAETRLAPVVPRDGRLWLVKRRRGSGGGGVRIARPGEAIPPGWHAQEYLAGRSGSATFLADGRRAVLLGATEQLAGVAWLGAAAFRHAGNLVEAPGITNGPAGLLSAAGVEAARRIAGRLTERFGLRGLIGFDFVAVGGLPHLIEVNPRWTASMELIEEGTGIPLCAAHLDACNGAGVETAGARTAVLKTTSAPAARRVLARGVLYASESIVAPHPNDLEALGARDRPHAGEIIEAGQPICTLNATGDTRDAAIAALRSAADQARRQFRESAAGSSGPVAGRAEAPIESGPS